MSSMISNTVCPLPGVIVWDVPDFRDDRGRFVKTFQAGWLPPDQPFDLKEEFYSVSNAGVIRGMHFQVPPADHNKMVTCVAGQVLDVLLDLRAGTGYGQHWSMELSADRPKNLWIPKGIAHGFLSLTDRSVMVYKTDHQYSPTHDRGIAWDSFGFQWPTGSRSFETSDRDANHPVFSDFETPFERPQV